MAKRKRIKGQTVRTNVIHMTTSLSWRLIYTFVYYIWNSRLWLGDLLSTVLTQLYVKVDILLYHSAANTAKMSIFTYNCCQQRCDTVKCQSSHITVSAALWYSKMSTFTYNCVSNAVIQQRCWHSYMWRLTFYCITALLTQLYVKIDILLYHSAADTVICAGWHFTVSQRCWHSYMWRLTFHSHACYNYI
jgi:hypothetical protein